MNDSNALVLPLQMMQLVAGAVLIAPLLLIGMFAVLPPIEGLRVLTLPAIGAGVVVPFVAFVLNRRLLDGLRPDADKIARARQLFVATIVPLALTEASALVGAMAFSPDRNVLTLIGPAAHFLFGAMIWPRKEAYDCIVI